jgi:hypothetical protein
MVRSPATATAGCSETCSLRFRFVQTISGPLTKEGSLAIPIARLPIEVVARVRGTSPE